jgi:V/A-type H+/Na+-transporting ATPase subunit I
VLGVIQVFTGILVKMYWNISQGRTKEALMDQGSWFIFLTGFLGWILASDMGGAVLSGTLAQVMNYLLYTGAILLVITQGRRQKNIVAKPFVGAIALYNVTGYFSDVLSYSRLLALGLATGLIALIVNLLAFMLYQGVADSIPIPIIGPLIAILVVSVFLVVAHLGNIALSLLGAIIHTLRLQYIEYFTKFYEGGGRTFTPFREVRGKVDIDHS